MGKIIKDAVIGNIPLYILSALSSILIIAGFICPPLAILDNSVLIASGELFAWGALFSFVKAIDNGVEAKMRHKDTEITVSKDVDE